MQEAYQLVQTEICRLRDIPGLSVILKPIVHIPLRPQKREWLPLKQWQCVTFSGANLSEVEQAENYLSSKHISFEKIAQRQWNIDWTFVQQ